MIDIYKKEHHFLLCPNEIEFIWSILGELGYSSLEYDSKEAKINTLIVLEKMIDLGVIFVSEWTARPELDSEQLTTKEIITHIDEIWFNGAKFPDFYGMVMFEAPKWYAEKIENLGFTHTTNWDWFVENKIGDLEKWIENNKPIRTNKP